MNKIISSAIAVSAITVSTVFGLTLVNVNSSKANPQSNRISQRNSTEKRVNKGKTQFLQGRGELKHVCKSKVEGGTCEYSETVTYTNEYSLNGTVDLKFLQTESGFKIGRQFSKSVRVNQKLAPNQALKIYVGPQGVKTEFTYQEKEKGQWVTKGTGSVTEWNGVTTNVMPCTHSAKQGGCGY